jgi:hypothetical protein
LHLLYTGGSSTSPIENDAVDRIAIKLLQVDGEELAGRIAVPGYLLLARAILLDPLGLACDHAEAPEPLSLLKQQEAPQCLVLEPICASWGFWALRTLSAHQRIVVKRSATLRAHQAALDPVVTRTWGVVSWAAAKVRRLRYNFPRVSNIPPRDLITSLPLQLL